MDHQLEKFLAVAEWRSFTKAARELHISQPALSVSIRNLERQLGVQLIVRGPNRFALTGAGKTVYESARRIRSELTTMHRLLGERAGNKRPLKIGMIDSIGELFFSGSTPKNLRFDVAVDSSRRLIHDLRLNRLDSAIVVAQLEPLDAGLTRRPLGSEPFHLVAHPRLAASIRRELKGKRLTSWLAYNPGSTTHQHFVRQWREVGVQAEPTFASTSPYLIKQMALSGRGAALLPKQLVENELKRGRLVLASRTRFVRPIWLVCQRGLDPGKDLQSVANAIKQRLL